MWQAKPFYKTPGEKAPYRIMKRDYLKISQEDVKRLYPQHVNKPCFIVRKGNTEIVYLVSVKRKCDGILISFNRIADTLWQVLKYILFDAKPLRGKKSKKANIVRALYLHNLIREKQGDDNYRRIIDQLSNACPEVNTIEKVKRLIDLDRKRYPVNPNRPDDYLEICGEIISKSSLTCMLVGNGCTTNLASILSSLLSSNLTPAQICWLQFQDRTMAVYFDYWFEL